MYEKTKLYDFIFEISQGSDDPEVKVGCIVLDKNGTLRGWGCNGLIEGMSTKKIKDSPKNQHVWILHAEIDAITETLFDEDLEGGSLYVNAVPCADCAKVIARVGIKNVYVVNEIKLKEKWKESNEAALKIFQAMGIKFEKIEA